MSWWEQWFQMATDEDWDDLIAEEDEPDHSDGGEGAHHAGPFADGGNL